jgi:hypothetical protein
MERWSELAAVAVDEVVEVVLNATIIVAAVISPTMKSV